MEATGASPVPAAMPTPATIAPDLNDPKPSIETTAQPATAPTPPTSEEMNNELKQEDEESELSELDLDDDDEEIFPDHYWEGGKIPVFKPTMDQFRSFKKFMEKVDKYGMKSGIVKVIPPPEWRETLPDLDEHVKKIKIKNPITQEFNGTFGAYTQQNVEKQRSYKLPEWKAMTEEPQNQPPAKRGERRRNQEKVVRGGGGPRARAAPKTETSDEPAPKRKPGRPARNSRAAASAEPNEELKGRRGSRQQVPPTPDSPATKPAEAKKAAKPRGRPSKGGGAGQAKSVTSRRLNNTSEATDNIDEAAFEDFDYHMDGLDEFTPERCAELETLYWKSLAFNQPMYGADMPGSLFDEDCNTWNVAKLENLLDVLGTKVPGVNTAYLYMGMWKATFAWHLEDVDLYSINYIHFGAPKQWYSISQEDARKFEKAMKNNWPMDAKHCDQFLRHKTYLISPDVLQKQYGVKVNKLVHYEGEFVITYPYGYHSGYNIGYNCAESVNFALESWLEFGRIAKKCNCESDNVWVDVAEIERKLRGEPTPEYYEETDDDDDLSDEENGNLPSPPASVKGKAQKGRKRKREVKEEKPKKKRRIRIQVNPLARQPCAMCPNDNPWEAILPTDNGVKAHLSCALYTPETWINKGEDGVEKVCGVASIDRARLELKCNFCRSKRGACFQCSSKKCTRAFHATCALAAGVQIDAGMVPTFGEDGTEYKEMGYDFRCRYHRPKIPKNVNIETLENSKRINNYAKELKPNDVVQAQYIGGEVFAGLVLENRPGEMSVFVEVLPDGERVEVEYKWLTLLNPDDSQRPQPSAAAVLMPEGMNRKQVSVNNRQDGVPTQGELFNEGSDHKVQDFFNMHMPPPGYARVAFKAPQKLKVDLNQPDQLYFYLGNMSTDAKCYYTVKAGSNEVAPKANFLERVNPAPAFQHVPQRMLVPVNGAPGQKIARKSASSQQEFNSFEKPYQYKPRTAPGSQVMWSVDPQALATQRNFLAEAGRRPPELHQAHGQSMNYHGSDPARNEPLVRSFPREHCMYTIGHDNYNARFGQTDAFHHPDYSTATLPAAFRGEYSGFVQHVRRESGDPQTMQRPNFATMGPQYQSQQSEPRRTSSGAFTPGGTAVAPWPHQSSVSRPSSSAHSHPSPYAAPTTPATTASVTSKEAETAPGYLEHIKQFPYLLNCYLRKTKAYESPYPHGGGFSAAYQPLKLDEAARPQQSKHTPSASMSSNHADGWTPPSQRALQSPFSRETPPLAHQPHQPPPHMPYQQGPPPQGVYRSPYGAPPPNYQQGMPSTASREGAQSRSFREQGSVFAQYGHAHAARAAVDTAMMFNSPKAPTPSPLSDTHTPRPYAAHTQGAPPPQWTIPPRATELPPMQQYPPPLVYAAAPPSLMPENQAPPHQPWQGK